MQLPSSPPSRWWNLCLSCSQTVQLLCGLGGRGHRDIISWYLFQPWWCACYTVRCSNTPVEFLVCGWQIQTIRTIHKARKCFLFPISSILPFIATTTTQLLPDFLLSPCHLSHKGTSKRQHWRHLSWHCFWHLLSPVCSDWSRDASHSVVQTISLLQKHTSIWLSPVRAINSR